MIIDFHTHILPPSFAKQRATIAARDRTFAALFPEDGAMMATAEDLLLAMDEDGIDVSVVLGYGWTNAIVARASNDYLLESASESRGRIIAFCSVDPSWGDAALREVERCVKGGARGIGELHPTSQKLKLATDEHVSVLMDLAIANDLPVVIHGSEPVGHAYAGKGETHPSQLLALAERFPQARLVGAHWGGGLPFYALMPEVRKALSNAWFDSAASPFLYDSDVYAIIANTVGPQQMLFGSDFPLLRQKRITEEAVSKLKPMQAAKFLGENAEKLLGL